MMNFLKKLLNNWALVLGTIFFIIGVLTLPHYGINWDTINHLPRGQAYLNFFLTGRKDFSGLAPFKGYWQNPDSLFIKSDTTRSEIPSRSLYQSDGTTHNWYVQNERGGHPPLSDIFSAFFNKVFFQKLGLINDIDSYRIYGIFLASILVGLIYCWISKKYGKVAGLVSAISLASYPLFWAESHFNAEKDIPETVFWALTTYFFFKGVTERKIGKIFISSIFFGLALGTKFNILFIVFILGGWLLAYWGVSALRKINVKFSLSFLLIPIVGIVIFFVSWPFLWGDPFGGLSQVIGFYKGLGLTQSINPRFIGPFGINTYPLKWILFTTPEIVLVLTSVGIIKAISQIKKEKDKFSFLIMLWLIVPIVRVTLPGTTIYGGIRQIMEFIPAMAILSGLGAKALLDIFKAKEVKALILVIIFLAFGLLGFKLYKIHPNENVYFNSLIGGLSGAKAKNIPSWGNTFGAAYRQGVSWINKNAEEGANVVLVYELLPNIPSIFFRKDINFHNSNRSGYLMEGEYAITLIYEGTQNRSYYDMYLGRFIEPVYEVKVDGVAILKVWKNDREHLKKELKESQVSEVKLTNKEDYLLFDLGKERKVARLEIDYMQGSCEELKRGIVRISKDGVVWEDLPGVLPQSWKISKLGQQPKGGHFIEPFVGQEARYIQVVVFPADTCLKRIRNYKILEFLN